MDEPTKPIAVLFPPKKGDYILAEASGMRNTKSSGGYQKRSALQLRKYNDSGYTIVKSFSYIVGDIESRNEAIRLATDKMDLLFEQSKPKTDEENIIPDPGSRE